MKNLLFERLNSKIVIFDGAMGTELYKKHFFVNVSYENLCLANPKAVQEIHQSYKDAGAEVLTANSYGANFNNLYKFGLGDKVKAINSAAIQIARKVAGNSLLVAGSVGPIGELPDDLENPEEKAVDFLIEQISAQVEAGADFIIFETTPSWNDLIRIQKALEKIELEFPYVISFVFNIEGKLQDGTDAEIIFQLLDNFDKKPTAFGLNCGLGPDSMLEAVEKVGKLTNLPLIVQPNAIAPKQIGGRTINMCSPEYFTTYAMRYAALGVKGIGGCCGTSPDDILDMARSINPLSKSQSSKAIFTQEITAPTQEAVKFSERSTFASKLAAKKWVTNVEIVPPQGFELQNTIEKAIQCRKAGFDAINIPDGPRASSRVSALVTAHMIQEKAGIEAILHQCCRDKNLIGMQSDLLGCTALGINNILFITGDPPKLGDYPFASGVFDIDSIGIIKIQNRLNHGLDLAGKAIPVPTKTAIGAGADPNAIDMDREIRRTIEKIEAGAEYIITQPVFDPDSLLRFIDKIPQLANIPVIAGIWPLASLRNAEFMKTQVPGVVVPDQIIARMAKAETKEAQLAVGIEIAREAIEKIRSQVAGVQVSAPFGKVEIAIEVIS